MKKSVKEDTEHFVARHGITAILRELTMLLLLEGDDCDRIDPGGGDYSRRAANKVWNGMLARLGARSDVVLKGTEKAQKNRAS